MKREDTFQAMAHEERRRIVAIALGREDSWSPKEMHQAIGKPLPNVSYHVKILRELGAIRVVKRTPRRGAVEHFYRFTPSGRRLLTEAMGVGKRKAKAPA